MSSNRYPGGSGQSFPPQITPFFEDNPCCETLQQHTLFYMVTGCTHTTQSKLHCAHTHTHTLCEGSVPLSPLARCIHGLQGRKTLMRVRNQPGHRTGPQQAPTHDATKLKHEQCNSMPINLVQNQTHIEKIYMDDLPFWLP